MFDSVYSYAKAAMELILGTAELLVANPVAPGYFAIAFGLALIFGLAVMALRSWRMTSAIAALRRAVEKSDPTPESFVGMRLEICAQIAKMTGWYRRRLRAAWHEFDETLVPPKQGGVVSNTVRPVYFFNQQDIDFEHRFARHAPALFISFGLLGTFLGLVAALDATGDALSGDSTEMRGALEELLIAASAKFTISIAGLFCSLIFSLIGLRLIGERVPLAFHHLCTSIETRLVFASAEGLLAKQIEQGEEVVKQLKSFNADLAAKVGQEVGSALAPVARAIETATGSGVEKASASVQEAMSGAVSAAAGELSAVTRGLGETADKLASSNSSTAGDLATAVDRIGTVIGGLEDRLGSAGEGLESGTKAVAEALSAEAEALRGEIGAKVTEPVTALVGAMTRLEDRVTAAVERLESFGGSVERGTEAARDAQGALTTAAGTLREAASPIQSAVERVATAAASIDDGAITTRAALTEALAEGRAALEQTGGAARASLDALRGVIETYADAAESADQIDEKLGAAHQSIQQHIDTALSRIREHTEMTDQTYGKSLNKLNSLIEQIEAFRPGGGG